jgi:hypothetical protein
VLTPTQKGSIAEAVIAAEAAKLGVNVLGPLSEGGRYDLVFEINDQLFRIQCKSEKLHGAVIVVPTRTCRRTPRGYARTTYDASEIDAIAVYCHESGGCHLLPIGDVRGRWETRLRLTPARNNHEFAITYAATYAFPGAIAQLGERVTGSHEVAGSSPASSTTN